MRNGRRRRPLKRPRPSTLSKPRLLLRKGWRLVTHPYFLVITLGGNFLVLLCAAILYLTEAKTNPSVNSPFDALWWAVTTVTTVGYGDIIPETTIARIAGMFLMIFGTGLFCAYTALMADVLLTEDFDDVEDRIRQLEDRLERAEKFFLDKTTQAPSHPFPRVSSRPT